MARTETVIAVAEFDSRIPKYWLIRSLWVLAVTCVGIPLVPLWAIVGWIVHHKQYDALDCQVTERSINISKGFLFTTQKNIPLDKITDLAVKEGPILRALGLCNLTIETAGGGQGDGMGHAHLIGVVDALKFRDMVLEQRDKVGGGAAFQPAPVSDDSVLVDIRDSLLRIEARLKDGK
jgi:putative membrane protein